MDERSPRTPPDFRVLDRSDRVFLYGFARVIPAGIWLGGIAVLMLVAQVIKIPPFIGLPVFFLFIIGAIWLDRSKVLDPVEFINFGEFIMVKRMMTRQSLPPERVKQIAFASPAGEDYDEYDTAQQKTNVTIHFKRAWTARVLATQTDAASIANWARANGVKIFEESQCRSE